MKNSWETDKDGTLYGVHLLEKGKVVIWQSNYNPPTEIGSAITHQDFLDGNGQSFVKQYFGTSVLEAIISQIE